MHHYVLTASGLSEILRGLRIVSTVLVAIAGAAFLLYCNVFVISILAAAVRSRRLARRAGATQLAPTPARAMLTASTSEPLIDLDTVHVPASGPLTTAA